jgi:hypothetical protein
MLHSPRAIFLFGHQRSGTNLLFRLLGESLGARLFNEDNEDAFCNFRLRDVASINTLIAGSDTMCIFKPVSQTISFIEILERTDEAKGVLIFRNPLDVVLSSLREFGATVHELNHDIAYNFMQNRLHDLGITLADWRAIDAIADDFRGRFSLSSDFASKFALSWLLLHTTLLQRGITRHPGVALISYEDLVSNPGIAAARLSRHLCMNISLPEAPLRQGQNDFFTDRIDVQLARDCIRLFEYYRDAARAVHPDAAPFA